jgi:CBS domain-containing protein
MSRLLTLHWSEPALRAQRCPGAPQARPASVADRVLELDKHDEGVPVASCGGDERRIEAADLVRGAMVRHPKTLDTESTLADVEALFADDHVHMALVVAADHRLVTTIERSDLPPSGSASTPVIALGTLSGRVTSPQRPLSEATAAMLGAGRRRLAVVDHDGRLLGLLCLKRSGDGFCSDEGIASRAAERARGSNSEAPH